MQERKGRSLFVLPDGNHLMFCLDKCKQKKKLRRVIHDSGGHVVDSSVSGCVLLVSPGFIVDSNIYIHCNYVFDCIRANRRLPMGPYGVVCGVPVPSNPPTYEDMSSFHSRACSNISVRSRKPFSKQESTALLKYITENNLEPLLNKRSIWKQIEVAQVTNHSAESMRSHYRQILKPLLPKPLNGKRTRFTLRDDEKIMNYLLDNKMYRFIRHRSLWQKMAQKRVTDHPAESMRNRFLRYLMNEFYARLAVDLNHDELINLSKLFWGKHSTSTLAFQQDRQEYTIDESSLTNTVENDLHHETSQSNSSFFTSSECSKDNEIPPSPSVLRQNSLSLRSRDVFKSKMSRSEHDIHSPSSSPKRFCFRRPRIPPNNSKSFRLHCSCDESIGNSSSSSASNQNMDLSVLTLPSDDQSHPDVNIINKNCDLSWTEKLMKWSSYVTTRLQAILLVLMTNGSVEEAYNFLRTSKRRPQSNSVQKLPLWTIEDDELLNSTDKRDIQTLIDRFGWTESANSTDLLNPVPSERLLGPGYGPGVWPLRERLALASALLDVDNQQASWSAISRQMTCFSRPDRPSTWCSTRACAKQYALLLDSAELTRRQKLTGNDAKSDHKSCQSNISSGLSLAERVVKRLTAERVDELRSRIRNGQHYYSSLKKMITDVEAGQYDNQLEYLFNEMSNIMKDKSKKSDDDIDDANKKNNKSNLSVVHKSSVSPPKSDEKSMELNTLVDPHSLEDQSSENQHNEINLNKLKETETFISLWKEMQNNYRIPESVWVCAPGPINSRNSVGLAGGTGRVRTGTGIGSANFARLSTLLAEASSPLLKPSFTSRYSAGKSIKFKNAGSDVSHNSSAASRAAEATKQRYLSSSAKRHLPTRTHQRIQAVRKKELFIKNKPETKNNVHNDSDSESSRSTSRTSSRTKFTSRRKYMYHSSDESIVSPKLFKNNSSTSLSKLGEEIESNPSTPSTVEMYLSDNEEFIDDNCDDNIQNQNFNEHTNDINENSACISELPTSIQSTSPTVTMFNNDSQNNPNNILEVDSSIVNNETSVNCNLSSPKSFDSITQSPKATNCTDLELLEQKPIEEDNLNKVKSNQSLQFSLIDENDNNKTNNNDNNDDYYLDVDVNNTFNKSLVQSNQELNKTLAPGDSSSLSPLKSDSLEIDKNLSCSISESTIMDVNKKNIDQEKCISAEIISDNNDKFKNRSIKINSKLNKKLNSKKSHKLTRNPHIDKSSSSSILPFLSINTKNQTSQLKFSHDDNNVELTNQKTTDENPTSIFTAMDSVTNVCIPDVASTSDDTQLPDSSVCSLVQDSSAHFDVPCESKKRGLRLRLSRQGSQLVVVPVSESNLENVEQSEVNSQLLTDGCSLPQTPIKTDGEENWCFWAKQLLSDADHISEPDISNKGLNLLSSRPKQYLTPSKLKELTHEILGPIVHDLNHNLIDSKVKFIYRLLEILANTVMTNSSNTYRFRIALRLYQQWSSQLLINSTGPFQSSTPYCYQHYATPNSWYGPSELNSSNTSVKPSYSALTTSFSSQSSKTSNQNEV